MLNTDISLGEPYLASHYTKSTLIVGVYDQKQTIILIKTKLFKRNKWPINLIKVVLSCLAYTVPLLAYSLSGICPRLCSACVSP